MKSTSSVNDASDNPSVPSYLIMNIEELGSRYEGTNDILSKAFARLYDFEELDMGDGVKFREYQCKNIVKIFNPRKNLTKLSIKILLPDGTVYSFGDDTVTTTLLSLGFRIKVLQKKLVSTYIDKTN